MYIVFRGMIKALDRSSDPHILFILRRKASIVAFLPYALFSQSRSPTEKIAQENKISYNGRRLFMEKTKTRRSYKDSLFRMVFREKKELLSLYNAINGTDYDDPEALTVTTIEDALYIRIKNDISFLIENVMNLYEEQSSWNPNMPLRGLFYFSNIYQGYVGQNQELMEACKKLGEYSYFVAKVRENLKEGLTLETAVDRAVVSCIREDVLRSFLEKHRMEVKDVILTEFDEELHNKTLLEEGREEGKQVGTQSALICYLKKKGLLTKELEERVLKEEDLGVLEKWQNEAFDGRVPE